MPSINYISGSDPMRSIEKMPSSEQKGAPFPVIENSYQEAEE